jgi:hypothetical protein
VSPITNASNKSEIEAWALAYPVFAVAVGQFLVGVFQGKVARVMPEGFGPNQRAVVGWAEANPLTAQFLFMRIGPQILKAAQAQTGVVSVSVEDVASVLRDVADAEEVEES